jgi:hypothetical protein
MTENYATFALISAIYDVDRIRIRVFPSELLRIHYPYVPSSWYMYINSLHWKSAAYLSRVSAVLQIGYVVSLTIKLSPRQEWVVLPGKVLQHPEHWARHTMATIIAKNRNVVKILWPYRESTFNVPTALQLDDFPQLRSCSIGQVLRIIASDRPWKLKNSADQLIIIPPVVVLQVNLHTIQYTPLESLETHLAYWENLLQVSLTHESFVAKRTVGRPEPFDFHWAQNGNPYQLTLSPLQRNAVNVKTNSPYTIKIGESAIGQGTVSRFKFNKNQQKVMLTLPSDTLLKLLTTQGEESQQKCFLSAAENSSTFTVAKKACARLFTVAERVPLPNVFHLPIWQQLIGFRNNNKALAAPRKFTLETPTQGPIQSAPYKDIAYHVLHGTNINPLSVIFGPPGAGKTTLLVALIYHVLIQNPEDQILVTAMTNTAVDNLLEKLLPIIQAASMTIRQKFRIVRMLPASRENQADPTPYSLLALALDHYDGREEDTKNLQINYHQLVAKSNEMGMKLHQPSSRDEENVIELRTINKLLTQAQTALEDAYLQKVRPNIVFATVVTAHNPRLHSSRYNFSPQSIFLDEACQINIPLTLTALQLLHPKEEKRIVLTGDVMQLAAVTLSRGPIADFLGYSLAEFLTMPGRATPFELNITYRSHPNLLKFPAAHFYPKGLYYGTPPEEREELLKRFPFPNPEFPILFISHEFPESKDQQQSKSNDLERKCIIQLYALLRQQMEISAEDIGIISFYSSQVNKLLRELQEAGFEDVPMDSVATAERFQGKEKSVILISCVRSSQATIKTARDIRRYLGFLDTRRLVSTITRAKSAMFIVGNSRHLSHHSFWRKYVDFCLDHNLIISAEQFQYILARIVSASTPYNWTRNTL